MNVIKIKKIKMDKCKYKKRLDFEWGESIKYKGGPLLINRWSTIAWNGLIMCKGKWLMH